VLILAAIVIFKSLAGWLGGGKYTKADNALSASFVGTIHLQLLIGLVLYFAFSPLGLQAFQGGMGAVMSNSAVRYWAVEHITMMIIGAVVIQIGRSRSKRMREAAAKHRTAFIFYAIGFLLVLSRIPWNEAGRMFRGL
jgi:hypothetical protein